MGKQKSHPTGMAYVRHGTIHTIHNLFLRWLHPVQVQTVCNASGYTLSRLTRLPRGSSDILFVLTVSRDFLIVNTEAYVFQECLFPTCYFDNRETTNPNSPRQMSNNTSETVKATRAKDQWGTFTCRMPHRARLAGPATNQVLNVVLRAFPAR